uniref:Uncharacterized protein n=1 Tax=Sphaerodactylus townsendi TaxID=933632 RepID=A0ACB8FEU3_9SAUR
MWLLFHFHMSQYLWSPKVPGETGAGKRHLAARGAAPSPPCCEALACGEMAAIWACREKAALGGSLLPLGTLPGVGALTAPHFLHLDRTVCLSWLLSSLANG